MKIETLQTLELLILFFFLFFGIELAQMKLDELVEDVMNLDINKESMDDNHANCNTFGFKLFIYPTGWHLQFPALTAGFGQFILIMFREMLCRHYFHNIFIINSKWWVVMGMGVNVWPNLRTRHEPDTGFFGLGLDLNGFGS